jgi:hypothetical protein
MTFPLRITAITALAIALAGCTRACATSTGRQPALSGQDASALPKTQPASTNGRETQPSSPDRRPAVPPSGTQSVDRVGARERALLADMR